MHRLTEIDIIILSSAQNERLRKITEDCVRSLLASEDPEKIKFNVLVVESCKELGKEHYAGTDTIYPEGNFCYNAYLNAGIRNTKSHYVCLCNNDLIFHPLWATELLKSFNKYTELSSASPLCPVHHPKLGYELYNGIYPGYRNRYEVAGWCIFIKRSVLDAIGKLDENYKLWCADNDFCNTLSVLGFRHALISSSLVEHLDSDTYEDQSVEMEEEVTAGEFFYFEKKWNYRKYNLL